MREKIKKIYQQINKLREKAERLEEEYDIQYKEEVRKIITNMNDTECIEVRDIEDKLIEVIYKLTDTKYIETNILNTELCNSEQLYVYLCRRKYDIKIKKIEDKLILELLENYRVEEYT